MPAAPSPSPEPKDTGLWQVRLPLPAAPDPGQVAHFLGFYEDIALSASCARDPDGGRDGGWAACWLFAQLPPDLAARLADLAAQTRLDLGKPDITAVADRDWIAESYRALPAFACGHFWIYGEHDKARRDEGAQKNLIPLEIEASTAFGSGTHDTTAGCLEALGTIRERLKEKGAKPGKILDLGCGSGILALAAEKLWPAAHVVASDNDQKAVDLSLRHAALNAARHITALAAEGMASPTLRIHGPYNLIIANILSGPLIDMAGEIAAALSPDGYLVLSGILPEQRDSVLAAYTAHGLNIVQNRVRGEWAVLILCRAGA